jgi:thiamine biosynthesis protein ThiS
MRVGVLRRQRVGQRMKQIGYFPIPLKHHYYSSQDGAVQSSPSGPCGLAGRLIDKAFERLVRCPRDAMQVQVNGEQRTLAAGLTVTGLLEELNIKPDRVAVELNLTILDRSEFDRKNLREGDRIEIISFIGGGGR